MQNNTTSCNNAKFIVVSNEKGGSGKTTVAIHLIVSLLGMNYKVAALDLDSRQQSLARYIENRSATAAKTNAEIRIPFIKVLQPSQNSDKKTAKDEDIANLHAIIMELKDKFDYIVIDTPGSATDLGIAACSYADILITPVSDSYMELDLLGQASAEDITKVKFGIHSATIWDQKMLRASRDKAEIKWFVVRNRIPILDTINNRNIEKSLDALAKKLKFQIINGFCDRVIFKELFLHGLTLNDAMLVPDLVRVTTSTVAARNELRHLMRSIGIVELEETAA